MKSEGLKTYNSNNGMVKDSIPSTAVMNNLIKNKTSVDNIRNSCVSLTSMKIPCFELKNDINKGTKTAEYYLNLYYHKKKNNNSLSRISIPVKNSKRKDSNTSYDESIIEEVPFNFKEHSLSSGEEEKIIKILKIKLFSRGFHPKFYRLLPVK